MSGKRAAALAAVVLWALLCARWFDGPHRGGPLEAVPPLALALPLLALGAAALWRRREPLREALRPRVFLVPALLALAFRLPLAWHGALGYLTPDGALSGLVALRILEGREHYVFVPSVPYSGSLKSHLAAGLAAAGMDLPRAFALASVLFYVAFVAAATRLAARMAGTWAGLAAGLFLAFAPSYVTRYSLSNDGNYVEVLALGTAALVMVARRGSGLVLTHLAAAGVLLGLAFWSHILAVLHVAAVALFLLWSAPRRLARWAAALAAGFAIGYAPGILWNAANGWDSFRYLVPGAASGTAPAEEATPDERHEETPPAVARPARAARVAGVLGEHVPVLLGHDFGHPPALDRLSRVATSVAALGALAGAVILLRGFHARPPEARLALLFLAVNLAAACFALPFIPGNPRYLLFSMAVLPTLLAVALDRSWGRPLFALLVALGAATALAQVRGAWDRDAAWRSFAAALEAGGLTRCTTDFFLATKINFACGERVICSAKLGPTTTEYFPEYRAIVERAPRVALVAVNRTAAGKLERRLLRLGVAFERRELMKPTLVPSRNVDPAELFPDRAFPLR